MKTIILIISAWFTYSIASAQLLEQHLWKERVLLLMTFDTTTEQYQEQLLEIKQNLPGYAERKIVLYTVTPAYYQSVRLNNIDNATSNQADVEYIQSQNLYQKYSSNKPFELLLIGYDGVAKSHKTNPVASQELFSIIDAMPIRQREMQQQRNN